MQSSAFQIIYQTCHYISTEQKGACASTNMEGGTIRQPDRPMLILFSCTPTKGINPADAPSSDHGTLYGRWECESTCNWVHLALVLYRFVPLSLSVLQCGGVCRSRGGHYHKNDNYRYGVTQQRGHCFSFEFNFSDGVYGTVDRVSHRVLYLYLTEFSTCILPVSHRVSYLYLNSLTVILSLRMLRM